MTYLIAIGIFASVILFIEAGYAAHHLLFNPETQRVKRRLRTWSTMNLRSHGVDIARKQILSEMPWLNDVLAQYFPGEQVRTTFRSSACWSNRIHARRWASFWRCPRCWPSAPSRR